ncbi:MAG: hypothetical protein WC796_05945 [Candidatus Pacearchaeota archaeon]|jgi:hypothetical protein
MNFKRAILIAIALWVVIFFEVSILMFGFKLSAPSTLYYVIHFIILIILFILASLFYFSKKVKAGAKQGLLVGILFIVVELILDAAITVPLFVKDWSFFIKPEMLASDLLALVIFTIVGALRSRKKK